jgi:hypothetical protein
VLLPRENSYLAGVLAAVIKINLGNKRVTFPTSGTLARTIQDELAKLEAAVLSRSNG